jgi:hypothetical protein
MEIGEWDFCAPPPPLLNSILVNFLFTISTFFIYFFLRNAVEKFTSRGGLPQETVDQLKARIKITEVPVKTKEYAPQNIPETSGAAGDTPPLVSAAKRKAEENGAPIGAEKRAKLEDEQRVYLEVEILRDSQVGRDSTSLSCLIERLTLRTGCLSVAMQLSGLTFNVV